MILKKKKYGQHFLRDKNIAHKIVGSLLNPTNADVLEIGPGDGILTKILIEKFKENLFLVEIDDELIPELSSNFKSIEGHIYHTDFLKFNLNQAFTNDLVIIGNFPYNISSQILFKVLENRHKVTELVGMFQKEVARRICSPSGSSEYGILSVLIQAYYKTEFLFTVSKTVFSPPPKVESAVIRLQRTSSFIPGCDEKILHRIVKQAFQQRRKTLRNSLKSFLPKLTDPKLVSSDIFSERPEKLTISDFIFLTKLFSAANE